MDSLQPHSYQVFHTPLTYEGWRHVPTTYIYCTLDAAIPIHIQKMMVEETAKGVNINTEELNAGHSPFINMPEAYFSNPGRLLGIGRGEPVALIVMDRLLHRLMLRFGLTERSGNECHSVLALELLLLLPQPAL